MALVRSTATVLVVVLAMLWDSLAAPLRGSGGEHNIVATAAGQRTQVALRPAVPSPQSPEDAKETLEQGKTVDAGEGLPSQGYHGPKGSHVNGESKTDDWGQEYGPDSEWNGKVGNTTYWTGKEEAPSSRARPEQQAAHPRPGPARSAAFPRADIGDLSLLMLAGLLLGQQNLAQ